eukprot:3368917-Rhodomonas_salina.2
MRYTLLYMNALTSKSGNPRVLIVILCAFCLSCFYRGDIRGLRPRIVKLQGGGVAHSVGAILTRHLRTCQVVRVYQMYYYYWLSSLVPGVAQKGKVPTRGLPGPVCN